MAIQIKLSDLGVKGPERVFRGETPHDVVEQVVAYLRKEHDIDMPDADYIVGGPDNLVIGTSQNQPEGGQVNQPVTPALGGDIDDRAGIIVTRLREQLDTAAEESRGDGITNRGQDL